MARQFFDSRSRNRSGYALPRSLYADTDFPSEMVSSWLRLRIYKLAVITAPTPAGN